MKSLRNELRPLLIYVAAFSFFINLLFLIPAIFTLQVFDRVIPSDSQETLIVLLGGTAIALTILLFLDYIRNRLNGIFGNIVEERLSPPVVNAIVSMLARNPHQAKMDGMHDVAALRNAFAGNGMTALFDAPWAPIYIAVIWAFHPALGMAAAACCTLMLILAWLNDRIARENLETLQNESRRTSHYVETSLRNAEVLQALGMTENLLARWRSLRQKVNAVQHNAGRSSSGFSAITRFLRQGIQVIMMSLGAYLVLNQEASPGVMIATTILLGKAVQPIEQLVSSWRILAEARSAFRRLKEMEPHFPKEDKYLSMPCPDGRVTVEGLAFRAHNSDKLILANISFMLEAGEALAVIGPSAAGKSTLARLLTGVWAPNSGSVRLDGADVSRWPRKDLSQWIGYLPQDVELFDGTVAENIARLGAVESEAVIAAARRANVHQLVLSLPQGYETRIGDHGLCLSPGQRQRIALARALYGSPRLVILDEPNANLDGEGELALAQALKSLRETGVTTVVITHRPSLIAHVDKLLVLDAGRVQHFGPPGDVLKTLHRQFQQNASEKAA